MTRSRTRSQAGWTLWETIVALNLTAIALTVFGGVFSSSESLVRETRARHRAEETLRRNLEALANVLRAADISTLDGFDENGTSTNLFFARVTGVDEIGPTYGAGEELRWQASPTPVSGVPEPGRVVHVKDGVETLVADRVPKGAFTAWLEGNALVVEVKTYYAVDNHVAEVTGSTAVALRN